MIPKSHPRYKSLVIRDRLVKGIEIGVTSQHGLIAHGRGEAFDYLIGEKTRNFAIKAIKAAASALILAKFPVISVNGNVAILTPKELVKLAEVLNAKLEVNLFHESKQREVKIKELLIKNGAKEVLLPEKSLIKLDHNRRFVNTQGIYKADLVLVPLEDGDRCKALRNMGKDVITIDLNPFSRTAKAATITIVDNVVRAMPSLITWVKRFKSYNKIKLVKILENYDNKAILKEAIRYINERLAKLSSTGF